MAETIDHTEITTPEDWEIPHVQIGTHENPHKNKDPVIVADETHDYSFRVDPSKIGAPATNSYRVKIAPTLSGVSALTPRQDLVDHK